MTAPAMTAFAKSALAALPARAARAAWARAEPGVAPLWQRSAGARWRRDPAVWDARADEAIRRGVGWFRPQADLTMSALYILWGAWRRGAEPRLGFIGEKIARYRATIRDPALRLFDPAYDPEAPEARDLPDVMQVRPYQPIELLMIEAVWADLRRPGPALLSRLAAIDDRGGYGTTHIVVAADLMRRSRAYPEADLRRLIAPTLPVMDRANRRTTYAGDLFAERAVMLAWAGEARRITPGQVAMLLARQRADGGWSARGVPPLGRSNQHTTALALTMIAEFRARGVAAW